MYPPIGPAPLTTALRLMVVVILATSLIGVPAHADKHGERAFNKRPRARLAMRLAREYLQQNRVGKAINWVGRAVNCPDATAAIRNEASRMEAKLRWPLRDLGFGVVEIHVSPPGAQLRVDGQLFRPMTDHFRLWLPSGSHQLDVRKTDFHARRQIMTAKAGEERRIDIKLVYAVQPVVKFVVKPVNAEIWLARDFLGFSNKRAFTLPPGKSLIEVRAPGHVSWVRTLTLRPGDKRTIEIFLERALAKGHTRRAASNVRRKLTPLELANRGERHRLGRRKPDRKNSRPRYRGSGEAPEVQKQKGPDWRKVDAGAGVSPAIDAPDAPDGPPPEADEADDAAAGDEGADAGVSAGAISGTMKGWIYSGIGVALLAGGVGASVYGVSQANYANGLSLGHSQYDSYYDSAANVTFAGYGSAGIGVASLIAGGIYLFGDDGLGERGRAIYLMGAGAVTGLAGAWLVLDAVAIADAANKLPMRHYKYDRDFDGAESNWRAGVIASGVGGAVALLGAWMFLTADSASAAAASSPSWLANMSVSPVVSLGQAGARLSLNW
ncbi:MAG: hypothetical protein KC502_07770 [Myxococcales bacterium]|nr:hypothetical protein [Myxococcales bacterium]